MRKDTRIKISRITFALLALTTWMMIFAVPVRAAPDWRGPGPRWHGDIRHFPEHDIVVWRGGHWVRGWHVSRFGWWWVIPGGCTSIPPPSIPIRIRMLLRS